MKLVKIPAGFSISIGLSIALLACSQPEKHPQKATKPVSPVAANQTATVSASPSPSEPVAAVPPPQPEERTIQFIPPVVSGSKQPTSLGIPDNTRIGCVEYTVEPQGVTPPEQEEPLAYAEEPAEFPGGSAALKKYLIENLLYPLSAKEEGIEGKCILNFIVHKTGEISDVKILRSLADCKQCDEEAKRLILAMPKWKPGKQNGKEVDSYYTLPIIFKLQ